MYYYADCAPSGEASFAIGFSRALVRHLFSNWPEHNAFQISQIFLCISYRMFYPPKQ